MCMMSHASMRVGNHTHVINTILQCHCLLPYCMVISNGIVELSTGDTRTKSHVREVFVFGNLMFQQCLISACNIQRSKLLELIYRITCRTNELPHVTCDTGSLYIRREGFVA